MKVAFCLSGHLRTFEVTLPTQIRNIIEPNRCDVFLSTWDVAGHGKHNNHNRPEFQQKLDISKVTDLLGDSLRGMVVHDFNEVQPQLKQCLYRGMVSMCWQMLEADRLRQDYEAKHNFTYDIVFRCRPDLGFNSSLKFDDFKGADSVLFTRWIDEILMDDQFAFAGSREMSIYTSIYNHLEEYDALKLKGPEGKDPWAEQILRHHVLSKGLRVQTVAVLAGLYRGGYDYG